MWFKKDEIGRSERCIGLHQCFFFSSFLDPRGFPTLVGIPTEEDFEQMKEGIIFLMTLKSKAMSRKKKTLKKGEDTSRAVTQNTDSSK